MTGEVLAAGSGGRAAAERAQAHVRRPLAPGLAGRRPQGLVDSGVSRWDWRALAQPRLAQHLAAGRMGTHWAGHYGL
jgi:hypothetical protein